MLGSAVAALEKEERGEEFRFQVVNLGESTYCGTSLYKPHGTQPVTNLMVVTYVLQYKFVHVSSLF